MRGQFRVSYGKFGFSSVCRWQLFLLCALMTVVVHSFAADSSLLDCCDLVGFCLFLFFFFSLHLMLAGRQPLGVWRWFQLFCFFHLVSAVCLTD